MGSAHVQMSTELNKPEIKLKMGVFWDGNLPDHNNAVALAICDSLRDGQPLITTRSLLLHSRGRSLSPHLVSLDHKKGIHPHEEKGSFCLKDVFETFASQFDFFVQKGGGLCVCLPKNLLSKEKLEGLNFHAENLLISTVDQLFLDELARSPVSVVALRELFQEKGHVAKLFHLVGHGDSKVVGGMEEVEYRQFLDFLGDQECLGFAVSSCYGGGESLLFNALPLGQKRKFVTLVRSVGDLPTHGVAFHEPGEMRKFYDVFARHLEMGKVKTIGDVRHMVREMSINSVIDPKMIPEAGFLEDPALLNIMNYFQVSFSHSGKAQSEGFRPVDAYGDTFAITHITVERVQLEQKGRDVPEIRLEGKKLIEIYPSVIDAALVFKGGSRDPYLFSMVPGNARHYIASVVLSQEIPETFMYKMIRFYGSAGPSKKVFFIEKMTYHDPISGKTMEYRDVCLSFAEGKGICVFNDSQNYYQLTISSLFGEESFDNIKFLSQEAHTFFVNRALKGAAPIDRRAPSFALQENRREIVRRLARFYTPDVEALPDNFLTLFFKSKRESQIFANKEEALAKYQSLGNSEKQKAFVFHLLAAHCEEAVIYIIQQTKLPVGEMIFSENSLALTASIYDNDAVVKYLYDHHLEELPPDQAETLRCHLFP